MFNNINFDYMENSNEIKKIDSSMVECPFCKNVIEAPSKPDVIFKCPQCDKELITYNITQSNKTLNTKDNMSLIYCRECGKQIIIRKTKRFAIPERAVYFLKTKRTAGGSPPPQNIFDRLTPVFT